MAKKRKSSELMEAEKVGEYTASQAAERLGISARMVRKYCQLGRIKARRVGPRVFVIKHKDLVSFEKIPRQTGNPGFHKSFFRLPKAAKMLALLDAYEMVGGIQITERDLDMAKRRAVGETLREIAEDYGCSAELVRQCTSRMAKAAKILNS